MGEYFGLNFEKAMYDIVRYNDYSYYLKQLTLTALSKFPSDMGQFKEKVNHRFLMWPFDGYGPPSLLVGRLHSFNEKFSLILPFDCWIFRFLLSKHEEFFPFYYVCVYVWGGRGRLLYNKILRILQPNSNFMALRNIVHKQ